MGFYGVLPETPSMGQLLARNLGQGASQGLVGGIDFAKQMALQKERGAGLANQTKQLEKVKMIETGLGTIDRMRELISSTGPSNWIQGLFGGETTKNRAEFEQLGRSLIPLVSAGVSIRNQKEFDEYKKVLTDPNARQAEIEGALDGLQNLLSREVEGRSEPSPEKKESTSAGNMMVKVKSPDGKILKIPKDKVKEAIAAGGKVVK